MEAIPFGIATVAFLIAAVFGARVDEIEIFGVKFKPFVTARARTAAGAAAMLCLIPTIVLAGVWPPGPVPGPSQSAGPSIAEATPAPAASASASLSTATDESPSASPSASPTVVPSDPPTAIPTPTPLPTATPAPTAPVAEWALAKRAELRAINQDLGEPSGTTLKATDGWLLQGFEHGIVYRNRDEIVIAIYGPIYDRWIRYKVSTRPAPGLGYPSSDQGEANGFPSQSFEKGRIQCTPFNGCLSLLGRVYTEWRQHFAKIGFPTTDTVVKLLSSSTKFDDGTISVNDQGQLTVCGPDGSTLEGGGTTLCGGPPPVGG